MMTATTQPTSWPKMWSIEAEQDLKSRLQQMPFYPGGLGQANTASGSGWTMLFAFGLGLASSVGVIYWLHSRRG